MTGAFSKWMVFAAYFRLVAQLPGQEEETGMKLSRIAAIGGLFVAALSLGTAAEARPDHDKGRHHAQNHDRGNHYGRNVHRRANHRVVRSRHCRTEWRHHRRVRVCR